MITVRDFRYAELREKVAETILEALAHLPEPQRSIFVWNHYYGYRLEQIAEILKWTVSDVETTLGLTNSMLYQKARALLAGDARVDTEAKLSGSVVSDEVGCCCFFSSSIKPDWGSHAQA